LRGTVSKNKHQELGLSLRTGDRATARLLAARLDAAFEEAMGMATVAGGEVSKVSIGRALARLRDDTVARLEAARAARAPDAPARAPNRPLRDRHFAYSAMKCDASKVFS
jgi:hypothetical protein